MNSSISAELIAEAPIGIQQRLCLDFSWITLDNIYFWKQFASNGWCVCLMDLPWSVGMRGTSLAAGDTQSIWLPLTCPSTSVRFPKEQVMPAERSGTWLTFTSSCTGTEAHDNEVNLVRQSAPTGGCVMPKQCCVNKETEGKKNADCTSLMALMLASLVKMR